MKSAAFWRLNTSVAILALSASTALADLTAQDVWADWEGYLTSTGYTVSSRNTATAGGLRIDDLVLTMDIRDEMNDADVVFTFTVNMGSLNFTETGDGSVEIQLPQRMPMTIRGSDDDGGAGEVRLEVTQTNPKMRASGDPDALTYDYSTALMKVALLDITEDGEPISPEVVRFSANISNVVSKTVMENTDGLRSFDFDYTSQGLIYDFGFEDPEKNDRFNMTGGADALSMSGSVNLPTDIDPEDITLMVQSGFSALIELSTLGGMTDINGTEGGSAIEVSATSDKTTFGLALSSEGVGYDIIQENISLNVAGDDIPLPISTTASEASTGFLIPVLKGDDPQPFQFGMTLADFTVPDFLWGMFDPAGQLPRDPATISFDISGALKVLEDLLDPEVAERMDSEEDSPFELLSMVLDELAVYAVGASLYGTGDFTFDNSDTETFDGLPRPVGFVDLSVAGANTLLDTLVNMGFVSDDDAMGARMMLSLFGVPGDEPDTINSRIEINEEGHVLANGQRIQ